MRVATFFLDTRQSTLRIVSTYWTTNSLPHPNAAANRRLRRSLWRKLRKAAVLAEELSPRIDLLELWTEELAHFSKRMATLARQINSGGRSHSDRQERTKRIKELRDLMLQVQVV